MLFLFLENFLVLIDLILRWKEVRVVWEGQAEAWGGASFFSFFPENLKYLKSVWTALDLHFLAPTDSHRSLQF